MIESCVRSWYCSTNVYGRLWSYSVLFMMEVRHLNERIIILVIHGSDSAWGWHKITRVIVFDQLISSHMRFHAIQGAHILHLRIRYD